MDMSTPTLKFKPTFEVGLDIPIRSLLVQQGSEVIQRTLLCG